MNAKFARSILSLSLSLSLSLGGVAVEGRTSAPVLQKMMVLLCCRWMMVELFFGDLNVFGAFLATITASLRRLFLARGDICWRWGAFGPSAVLFAWEKSLSVIDNFPG